MDESAPSTPVDARWSLVLALVAGGLAVGLVTADTVWSLQLRIESQDESGAWRTVSGSEDFRFAGPGLTPEDCATPSVRLVVDNDKPLPQTVRVQFWYEDADFTSQSLVDETWSLAAFEVRMAEAMVPDEAFNATQPRDDAPKGQDARVWVYGHAGEQARGQTVSACVTRGT